MRSRVAQLAFPITLGVLADSVLNLVGLIAVSRLSPEAVAAVGLSSYLFFLLNAVFVVFAGGAIVLSSQAVGAGRVDLASKALGEVVTSCILFSLTITFSSPFWLHSYLLFMSQGNLSVVKEGYVYALMRLFSLPALAVNVVISSFYRSADKPWPSTLSSVITACAGLIAIPFLTLEPGGMGVGGAGLATSIASYLGLAAYILYPPPIPLKLSTPSRLLGRVLLIGLPMASERLVASAAQNVYINAVARGGTLALAAHNIGITVENLVIQPAFAISMAALIEAGKKVGADNPVDTSTIVKESVKISVAWMGLAAIILASISPMVTSLFTSDPKIAELTVSYLFLAALSEVGLGVSQAFFGAIRGMGSVWLPFTITSLTVVVFRALPAQILSLSYGAVGAWITQNTDMYGRAILAFLAWKMLGVRKLSKKVI
ncbi:MAG: MATE family efflux transporter [Thermofilaceae archaeon]|nr:MATE family efflux transporter [Thermofilaceae archaeon]MCX8181001.1 MATE family efflux transporter [Thermofilaceae archaeon]MDW8004106.1 MATE family efflux transporter [Thermofilaceae archaeon]